MLTVSLGNLLVANEVFKNEWMQGEGEILVDHDLGQTLTEVKKFSAKMKLKAAEIMVRRLQCNMLLFNHMHCSSMMLYIILTIFSGH